MTFVWRKNIIYYQPGTTGIKYLSTIEIAQINYVDYYMRINIICLFFMPSVHIECGHACSQTQLDKFHTNFSQVLVFSTHL